LIKEIVWVKVKRKSKVLKILPNRQEKDGPHKMWKSYSELHELHFIVGEKVKEVGSVKWSKGSGKKLKFIEELCEFVSDKIDENSWITSRE
jgi:benzoyl-CoA reductase/2-hydroxyglutaryl-CoA dehydratase subunit BcrC/BadD/HgdB